VAVELVADTEPIELPGSEPRRESDASLEFPIWAECNEVAKVIPGIERNLGRLQFLQQKSVDDPDTRPNTAINSERYALSCKTILLCRQSVTRLKEVARSPASAGFKSMMAENSRSLLRSIEKFKDAEEVYAEKLRNQMVASYKIIIPEASATEAQAILDMAQSQMGFTAVIYDLPSRLLTFY
jgi:t-SNARE complex subunit (syntaxin)